MRHDMQNAKSEAAAVRKMEREGVCVLNRRGFLISDPASFASPAAEQSGSAEPKRARAQLSEHASASSKAGAADT